MNHQEIHNICKKYDITNYTINNDGSIDVNGDVDLYEKNLSRLPLRFNYINGFFDCSFNKLTSLKGSPTKVGYSFYCYSNKLISLKHAPLEIGDSFYCYGNLVKLDYGSYIKKVKRMNKLSKL